MNLAPPKKGNHVSPAKLPRIVVYLPPAMKEELEELADSQHRSVSNMVLALIAEAIEKGKAEGKIRQQ
jgi:hypothetical protein